MDEPRVFKVASPGGRRAFLQQLTRTAAVGTAAVVADDCSSKSPSAPTPVAVTTTTIRTTTTTSSTTTTIAPNSTLAGVVTDSSNARPIVGARVQVVDGPGQGKSSTTDGNGYYSIAGITHSSFTARATATNYSLQDQGLTLSRDTRLDFQLRPIPQTTTTTSTTTTTTGCSCVSNTGCRPVTLTYFYPN